MYKATYKCRMCGEAFVDSSIDNENTATAVATMVSLNRYHTFNHHTFTEKTIHECKDGSIGYADFVGFRREE